MSAFSKGVTLFVCLLVTGTTLAAEPFRVRGYYTIATRFPTAGLDIWKDIIDRMHEDRCELLIHWIPGGFRSKRFPETWEHNKDHANVKDDFTREMIDYAHQKGIKVLLGFSPFAYDGINRYTLKHPDLKATGKDGKPVPEFGIYCWGYSLCPGLDESQAFMLDYVREMIFDFYPNADGLFVESSDYSTCHCPRCGAKHFDNEYRFVRKISDEVWAKNPQATIVIYPHYFSGQAVPGIEAAVGSKIEFDPRYTLFFTPHSTKLNRELMAKAKDSLWWDPALIFETPSAVRKGARHARDNGFTGYVPSLEAYSYIPTRPEQDGAKWLVGRRLAPFGFGWVPPEKSPYNELPVRVNRIAYREFAANPDLPMKEFEERLGREVFGAKTSPVLVADLLTVQSAFFRDRDWYEPSPLAEPLRLREIKESGKLQPKKLAEYRDLIQAIREIEKRNTSGAGAEVGRIARWLAKQWEGENAALLNLPAK